MENSPNGLLLRIAANLVDHTRMMVLFRASDLEYIRKVIGVVRSLIEPEVERWIDQALLTERQVIKVASKGARRPALVRVVVVLLVEIRLSISLLQHEMGQLTLLAKRLVNKPG